MNAHIVPDTSVVVKWFRQGEILAGQALALRAAYVDGQIDISVPSLLMYELVDVLLYKDDLTTAQVEEAVQSLFDIGLESALPTAITMRRAAVIARETLSNDIWRACDILLRDKNCGGAIEYGERATPGAAVWQRNPRCHGIRELTWEELT